MQDDGVRQADGVLDIMAARGILHAVYELCRLGYFYDSAREVLTDDGYEVITRLEAFAFWPIYMAGASQSEVLPLFFTQHMSTVCSVTKLLTAGY